MVYGSISRVEEGSAPPPEDTSTLNPPSASARRAVILVGAIAATCLAGSAALYRSGVAGGRTELSFTSHLDLDKGALGALENAASARGSFRRGGQAFSDARPQVPAILKSRFRSLMAREAGSVGADDSEMLSSVSSKQSRREEAREGMHTQDYEDLTDAAGEE